MFEAQGEGESQRETWRWTGAITKGDADAFERFYRAWFDRTVALTRSISRRDDAFCLDVVQDTMLRVVRAMPECRDERGVESWLARTVLNLVIDRWRQDHRRSQRERAASSREAVCVDLDAQMESDEQLSWLRDRINELPAVDRRLLAERFSNDLTLAEIGKALGMTGPAVHGRIRRIVSRLSSAAQAWRRSDD